MSFLIMQIFKHYVTFYNDYGDIIKVSGLVNFRLN